MILAVDAGNSNIVLGCLTGTTVQYTARLQTDCTAGAADYSSSIYAALRRGGYDAADFEGVILSSVAASDVYTRQLITSVTCVVKGTLCGAASAAVYRLLSGRNGRVAVLLAAAAAPVVNTGVLYLVLALFFDTPWAAMLSAFMSVNFLIELVVNIALSPAVLQIVTVRRRAV